MRTVSSDENLTLRQLHIALMNSILTPRELLVFCGRLICPLGLKVVSKVPFVKCTFHPPTFH